MALRYTFFYQEKKILSQFVIIEMNEWTTASRNVYDTDTLIPEKKKKVFLV